MQPTMPKFTIFTTGYLGISWTDLQAHLLRLKALLIDIRYKPWSQNPRFTAAALRQSLGSGYLTLPLLGVQLYAQGGMNILDYRAGKRVLELHLKSQNLVLMCACKDAAKCHRQFIADMLIADGFTVEELSTAPQSAAQLALPLGVD